MDVQTYFFRRTNMNALGKPRSWTDHLLWHHACHTVDLFQYQTGQTGFAVPCPAGPAAPAAGHRHGHEHRHEGAHRARSAPCRCHSTTTGRWARSSATSATTAPTSPATMTCSMASNKSDRRVEGRRVDERHRAAGSRVFQPPSSEGREPNASVRRCCPPCSVLDRLEQQLLRAATASGRSRCIIAGGCRSPRIPRRSNSARSSPRSAALNGSAAAARLSCR